MLQLLLGEKVKEYLDFNMNTTRHILLSLFIQSFGVITVFAQSQPIKIDTLTGIPNLTDAATSSNLPDFLNNLYIFGIGIAAVLAVAMLIYGGFRYMTSEIPGFKTDAKGKILGAIFGLILVLLPVLVFSVINPDVIKLNPNLQKVAVGNGGGGNSNTGDGNSDNNVEKWIATLVVSYTQARGLESASANFTIKAKEIFSDKQSCKNAFKGERLKKFVQDVIDAQPKENGRTVIKVGRLFQSIRGTKKILMLQNFDRTKDEEFIINRGIKCTKI